MIASFLVASCIFACALSFSITRGDVNVGRGYPLSTASLNRISTGFGGVIPRLEPGLRWIGDRAQHILKPKLSAESTSFYYLDGLERVAAAPAISAGMTFGIAKVLGQALTKHTKLLAVAILLLLSGTSLTGGPVFASAASSLASQSAVRVEPDKPLLSRLLNFELNLFKFKKYSQLTPMERLATTPVFYMANSRGNAYLQADTQAGRPEQKIITYFMSSEDALAYLDEMTQSNSQAGGPGSAEFRLMTTSLERALNTVRAKKQSRKLGRYEVEAVHRIQPSSRQYENAVRVTKQQSQRGPVQASLALRGINIPLFRAQGLVLTRANGETVVPNYFALEDLKEDWASLRSASAAASATQSPSAAAAAKRSLSAAPKAAVPKIPLEPNVAVLELADVLCQAEGLTFPPPPVASEGGTEQGGGQSSQRPSPGSGLSAALKSLLRIGIGSNSDSKGSQGSATTVPAAAPVPVTEVVGFVPPRREIEMIRRFYRNRTGIRNEFSKSKLLA